MLDDGMRGSDRASDLPQKGGIVAMRGCSGDAPAVSVLTPIYNVEKYLPRCLDSLKGQTLKEIELICINDGSTDGSLGILKEAAEGDPRFVIVDKPNSGYGASMNRGLDIARGEYVGIVESDDFAEPDMFESLYQFAKEHDCDLVKSNYFEHSDSGDVLVKEFRRYRYRKVFDPADKLKVLRMAPLIWAGLYRRSMLEGNRIRFAETPGASFQDTSFVFKTWVSSRRAALLPEGYLHYRVDNAGSSVKTTTKIFEVCGEYAESEAFLERDPDRFETFAPTLIAMKLDAYRWNYSRIAPERREEFALRWAEEFRDADGKGILQRKALSRSEWRLVQELLEDPLAFCAAHPDEV